MDSKEFRNLLLLLRGDLSERDIPHRTLLTKQILSLKEEHIDYLSKQMLVSLFIILY